MAPRFDRSEALLYAMPERGDLRIAPQPRIEGRRSPGYDKSDPTTARPPDQSAANGAWEPSLDEPDAETRKSYSWGAIFPLRLNGPRDAERAQRRLDAAGLPHRSRRGICGLCGFGAGVARIAWGLAMLLAAWGESILATAPQWLAEWSDSISRCTSRARFFWRVTLAIFVVGVFSLSSASSRGAGSRVGRALAFPHPLLAVRIVPRFLAPGA
jgi:hypothetical protein